MNSSMCNSNVILCDGEDISELVARLDRDRAEWIKAGRPKTEYKDDPLTRQIQEKVDLIVQRILAKRA